MNIILEDTGIVESLFDTVDRFTVFDSASLSDKQHGQYRCNDTISLKISSLNFGSSDNNQDIPYLGKLGAQSNNVSNNPIKFNLTCFIDKPSSFLINVDSFYTVDKVAYLTPLSPSDGMIVLIGVDCTGTFSSHIGNIATYSSGWSYTSVSTGKKVYDIDTGNIYEKGSSSYTTVYEFNIKDLRTMSSLYLMKYSKGHKDLYLQDDTDSRRESLFELYDMINVFGRTDAGNSESKKHLNITLDSISVNAGIASTSFQLGCTLIWGFE